METRGSVTCICKVEKGLLKAPHACDAFADICCNPAKAKSPHTCGFCTFPWVLFPFRFPGVTLLFPFSSLVTKVIWFIIVYY